jgi:hypothetical protein
MSLTDTTLATYTIETWLGSAHMCMNGMRRAAEDPLKRLLVKHVLERRLEGRLFFHFIFV